MTIDPIAQFSLFLAAFLDGIAMGGLSELGKILQILLGAHRPPAYLKAWYERPLPLVGRALGWRTAPVRRAWRTAVSICADFLFPIIAVLAFLWIGFRFHGGVFRFSALLLFLLGVALWRTLCTPHLSPLLARAAFLLAAGLLYLRTVLLLPVRLWWRFLRRFCLLPLVYLWKRLLHTWHQRQSSMLCQAQLQAAARGFLAPQCLRRNKVKKGMRKRICRKKEKKAASLR